MSKITGVLILDIFGRYSGIYWLTTGYLCCWTVEELREAITQLKLPEFNPDEVVAVLTYNAVRHCCRSFRDTLRTQQSFWWRSSQSLERALTPISKSVARWQFLKCCALAISDIVARSQFLKSVGLPCPRFIYLLFETQGREVANRPSHIWLERYPNSVDVLQHLRSAGPLLDLPGSGPMETRHVVKLYCNLYEPSPTPILYVGPVSNLLG